MINYLDRATISMALPFISKDLHLDPLAKGVLLSAFFWSYALMQVPIGWCADRFNLRWLYAGAFTLWSIAQGLIGWSRNLQQLIAFRILLGIGESVYLPGGTKIVSLLFKPADRGLPCGLFDAGTRSGLVLEGIMIPWFLDHYGWRITFMLVGFASLLWLIPWFYICPPGLQDQTPRRPRSECPPVFDQIMALFSNRNLMGICLGFLCFDYYWYLLVTWLPDYLVTVRHLTIMRAGIYASLPYLVFGVTEPIGGWVADRLIRQGYSETRVRKGIVAGAFLTGLFLIPAARVTEANTAILLIILGSLVGLASGNMLVILQCCAPPNQVGLWTGIENFAGNLFGGMAPLVTGILVKQTGSYAPPFIVASCMLIIGLFSYCFIVGQLKRTDVEVASGQAV